MIPTELTLKGLWLAAVAAAFAVLLILLGVQTVRIEGFKVWPLSVEGWKPKAERLQRDLDAVKGAQKAAGAAAHAARLAQEAKYHDLAEKTDADLEKTRANALDDAERFIAAHRLPALAAGGSRGGAGTSSQSNAAQGPDGPGTAAKLDAGLVAVPEQDVRTCTANTARLVAGRDWAIHLND